MVRVTSVIVTELVLITAAFGASVMVCGLEDIRDNASAFWLFFPGYISVALTLFLTEPNKFACEFAICLLFM